MGILQVEMAWAETWGGLHLYFPESVSEALSWVDKMYALIVPLLYASFHICSAVPHYNPIWDNLYRFQTTICSEKG